MPRNCPEEAGSRVVQGGREVSIRVILVKGGYVQSSSYFFAEYFC